MFGISGFFGLFLSKVFPVWVFLSLRSLIRSAADVLWWTAGGRGGGGGGGGGGTEGGSGVTGVVGPKSPTEIRKNHLYSWW